jgi:hypothetical protein
LATWRLVSSLSVPSVLSVVQSILSLRRSLCLCASAVFTPLSSLLTPRVGDSLASWRFAVSLCYPSRGTPLAKGNSDGIAERRTLPGANFRPSDRSLLLCELARPSNDRSTSRGLSWGIVSRAISPVPSPLFLRLFPCQRLPPGASGTQPLALPLVRTRTVEWASRQSSVVSRQ